MKDMHSINKAGDLSHFGGVEVGDEITFFTPFNYMFPQLARDPASLIVDNCKTTYLLTELGQAMFEFQSGVNTGIFEGTVPAVFTYLGQFIDHDLTARTDRGTDTSRLDPPDLVTRRNPDDIVVELRNGRRPHFDLDSVYGDGPGMAPNGSPASVSVAEEFGLFNGGEMALSQIAPKRVDIPRQPGGRSRIADGRNDENLNISQLHAAFLSFHNKVFASITDPVSDLTKFSRARQLTRWAYQYLTIEEYLRAVCINDVVEDILANGPRHYGHTAGRGDIFMPLEFSVAAFRFGHTMVRPEYTLNGNPNATRKINDIFFPGRPGSKDDTERTPGNADDLLTSGVLDPNFAIDWEFFIPGGSNVQFARTFDIRLAQGLNELDFEETEREALRMLAPRNLLRSFSLSIPTGQAMARAMGLVPLDAQSIVDPNLKRFNELLDQNDLRHRTPLWFYLLREAEVHSNKEKLGELGSRIVCETIVGLMTSNPNSYMNNRHRAEIQDDGIVMPDGTKVSDIRSFLQFADVL